ncbi:MAG: magnesium transporter [Rickettsiales bacterium]|nr:magnesium transporter [Rickettsiales bacterium]
MDERALNGEEADGMETDQHILSPERVRSILDALDTRNNALVNDLVTPLHTQDLAELINGLSAPERGQLMECIKRSFDHDVLPFLDPEIADDVLEQLGHRRSAEVIGDLELDDALHVLEDLDQEDQQEILKSIDPATRKELEAGLSYPEESAGRLMRRNMVFVPEFWSVGDTIDYLRRHSSLPEEFYVIYVINPQFRPIGLLSLATIMRHPREAKITDLMQRDLHRFTTSTDQEEVAFIFRKYGLVEAPVIGEDGRLIGSITVDDAVEVMREELEEDFMRSSGLSSQEMSSTVFASVRTRFPWLFVNLITAMLAAAVVNMFGHTIEHLVLLAVLMPIVASMGGNTGIQASTVTVRAIAMRRVDVKGAWHMVRKEVLIGGLSGIGIATITGVGIVLVYGNVQIALVFALAMVLVMVIAGLAGAGLPVLMRRLGIDPAITSGVFLTMLTDIVGFLSFLGLATLVVM